jgi:hypothetical protein
MQETSTKQAASRLLLAVCLMLDSCFAYSLVLKMKESCGSNQSPAYYLLHAGFLFVLLFNLEGGGDIFLRNFG